MLKIIVKHDNVLSAHTIQVFYLLHTMHWHYRNVVTFGMCLRHRARARVCNQRIIAHSFQSLGRHKFTGSSLLYALPKTVDGKAHAHTRVTIPVYMYTPHNVVLMKNKNFINQCHFIMRAQRESNTLSKRGSPIFAFSQSFP